MEKGVELGLEGIEREGFGWSGIEMCGNESEKFLNFYFLKLKIF